MITSNSVTVDALPTCNSEQYYDSVLKKCICYSDNASEITLTLNNANPTFPLFNAQYARDYALYVDVLGTYGGWLSGNSCPSNYGSAPYDLPKSASYKSIQLSGKVTDVDGNACGDTGVCAKYKVYFWLNEYSFTHTFNQGGVDFTFTFKYEIWQGTSKLTDSNGILNGIYADANGNFDVSVRIYISSFSYHRHGAECPTYESGTLVETPVIYAGFAPNNTVAVQDMEYTIKPCVHCYFYFG